MFLFDKQQRTHSYKKKVSGSEVPFLSENLVPSNSYLNLIISDILADL